MNKKIKTLTAAFKAIGYAPGFVPNVSDWPEAVRPHKIAEFNLEIAIMAVSGKDKVNMLDPNQPKYYPWFRNIEKKDGGVSGRGLSLDVVVFVYSYAHVGPRLLLASREAAEHMAKHFLPQYEAFYLSRTE